MVLYHCLTAKAKLTKRMAEIVSLKTVIIVVVVESIVGL